MPEDFSAARASGATARLLWISATSPAAVSTVSGISSQTLEYCGGRFGVQEAGARLSNFVGHEFSIWGNETLASNGLIHDEMVGIASATSGANQR